MAVGEGQAGSRAAGWVRRQLGYEPLEPALFARALTHRSAGAGNNERLEFLGDAVLNLVVAGHLYHHYPQADEGALSRLRAAVVSGESLARVAAGLELGAALELGAGELKTGGFRRESILADALEALCGAVFLDGGLRGRARAVPAGAGTGARSARRRAPKPRRPEGCEDAPAGVAAGARAAAAPLRGAGGRAASRMRRPFGSAASSKQSMPAPRARARAAVAPSRRPRRSCSARLAAMSALPHRLRRARRPAERRQVDAAQCAARPEAQHRDPAAADHAPSHARVS